MDSAGPASLISQPAIYLTEGFMRKGDDLEKNVIQSTWTRSTDFSKASALPFSARWSMLLNFGKGIKSGAAICLVQIILAITYYVKYVQVVDGACKTFGYCDQKIPGLMEAMFILVLCEIVVDSVFGVFYLVRSNHIQNLVFWVSSHSDLRPSQMYQMLGIMAWAVFAYTTLTWILLTIFASIAYYYETDMWYQYFFVAVNCMSAWCTMFLSVLWVWENWLLSKVGDYLVKKRLETDFGTDGIVAGLKCHELLQKMSEVSRVWALNHAFRIVFAFMDVTVYIAWYLLFQKKTTQGRPQLIQKTEPVLNAVALMLAFAYYGFVAVTLLAPGYVTSKFFISLQLKVSQMTNWVTTESMRPRSSNADEESKKDMKQDSSKTTGTPASKELVRFDQQHEVRNFQQTCTMFMVRFAFTKDAGGMHFAGFPISVGQALTGIFILAYIQYDICKYIVSS